MKRPKSLEKKGAKRSEFLVIEYLNTQLLYKYYNWIISHL